MGTTRASGAPLVADEYREVISDALADFLAQNTSSVTVLLVKADTQPAVDFGAPHTITPGDAWMRTNTADTPLLQGKVWMRLQERFGFDKEITIAITE